MTDYTVIIDHFPSTPELADKYLDALRQGFPDAEQFITAANHAENWRTEFDETFLGWAARHGVRAVEDAPGGWQALNQATAMAESRFVVILEEDWWPSPDAGRFAMQALERNENSVVYFERRDTAPDELDNLATGACLRSSPRALANPGLAFAVQRSNFLHLRGYDERAAYARAAGIDLKARLRRSGHTQISLEQPDGVVYHAPEPTQTLDDDGKKSVAAQRDIAEFAEKDKSIYRNLVEWSLPPSARLPLVSVAIATKDRGEMIADSINSVLYQTFQDFEIIIIDDGSVDDLAEQAVRQIADPRVTYIRQEPSGISAARNRAADMTSCPLTAVHDDDDIMLPDRLEQGISALASENDASYGSWINFSDLTGEMRGFLGKVGFGADINAFNGQGPGHSTWTLPTWLIRRVRYDQRLTASVDHNLATRLDLLGVRWVHTEQFMYLRRVHEKQVTASDGAGQKIGHVLTRYGSNLLSSRQQLNDMRAAGKAARYPVNASHQALQARYAGFLPDKLVRREVTMFRDLTNAQFAADLPHKMAYIIEDRNLLNGRAHLDGAALDGVTLEDLAHFRGQGLLGMKVSGVLDIQDDVPEVDQSVVDATDVEVLADQNAKSAADRAEAVRTNEIVEEHLKKYPTGSVLVEHNADPYHEFVDEALLDGATTARRVVAAGEFGANTCSRIYGYAHRLTGLTRLRDFSATPRGASFALHTNEQLEGLLTALSPDGDDSAEVA